MTPRDEPNPLLDVSGPPRYDRIRAEHGEPAVRTMIADAEATLDGLLASGAPPTWERFCAPLDDAEERLERAWSVLRNLDSTLGTDELRAAHRVTEELMTAHHSRVEQDERLYRVYRDLAEGARSATLSPVERRVLANDLRDFRLAGVHLPPAEKARCREIKAELAALASTFADNVTDDANAFRLVVDRAEQVEGLPATLVAAARERAETEIPDAPGPRWSFTLDQSSVLPFAMYQRDRGLRERMLRAWTTRASTPPRDNAPLVKRTLVLRKELATLLGFANFAELSLVPKMARSAEEVRGFLLDLADRALPAARRETAELADLARRESGIERLERHDVAYHREVLRQRLHGFSQESLRPYFPLPRVLSGLGEVLRRLYGVSLRVLPASATAAKGVPTAWHPDVQVIEVSDAGHVLGHVLFDPYSRRGKRSGAWVSPCVVRRRRADGTVEQPIAHLVCNFPEPFHGRPSLLAHDEVRTLFHEFGHAIHNLFSTVDHRTVSGTRGVPWDGVEFPSQFHENWVWNEESLALISGHVDTGEPLPADLLAKMRAARHFFAASDLLRQVEQSLIDLELHTTFDPERDDVRALIESVRNRVCVVPAPAYDRIENSFLHIFQGAYAAGYYGYKWAEVLAADAFGRFEEEGIFAAGAASDFRRHVLAPGGSEDFLDLFVRFRGRAPDPAALLRQSGIA